MLMTDTSGAWMHGSSSDSLIIRLDLVLVFNFLSFEAHSRLCRNENMFSVFIFLFPFFLLPILLTIF